MQTNETHAPWQKEFFKNIETFQEYGLSQAEARKLLSDFLKLSNATPRPKIIECFQNESVLERFGVYNKKNPEIRDFMMKFFNPLLKNFSVRGLENFSQITSLLDKVPIVLISNHLSHLDTAAIYFLLYQTSKEARRLADKLVFIAGRLAFEPDFTRLGVYMIDTLLVCSRRDMQENPGMADLMTRINMRSFRQSQELQKEAKVIAIFPEGTRSRTGRLLNFVDSAYHFVNNKIIIPISLEGTENILPPDSFLFRAAQGRLSIGKAMLIGKLAQKQMELLPDNIERLHIPNDVDKRQYLIDNLALLVGRNLHHHRHGTYRNLYNGNENKIEKNILIQINPKQKEKIAILGHSSYSVALAALLANKECPIYIFIDKAEKAIEYNRHQTNFEYYPLFKLPKNIKFVTESDELQDSTLWIQGVHFWEIEAYYTKLKNLFAHNKAPLVNIIKGFVCPPLELVLDYLWHKFSIEPDRMAALAGANYPDQIMERKYTGFELAAYNTLLVDRLLPLLNTAYVSTRPALNPDDVRGVQLGGALKNIYALGIGLIDGYYYRNLGGNNDNSLFHISNPTFSEMSRLGVHLGGRPATFQGLSGLSDFMLSCFAQDAEDRQYGFEFIQKDDENKSGSQQIAGIHSLRLLGDFLGEHKESYPIAYKIHEILIQKQDAQDRIQSMIASMHRNS